MRINVLLSTAALVAVMAAPAAACSWGEAKMTVAEVPAVKVTAPAPVELALRDVWLERMVG